MAISHSATSASIAPDRKAPSEIMRFSCADHRANELKHLGNRAVGEDEHALIAGAPRPGSRTLKPA
jgi:hypothetical protein